MEQIKMTHFGSAQGANHSDTSGVVRIWNAAMTQKTRLYVPDGAQHCTRASL
jgi:hypothetical protein